MLTRLRYHTAGAPGEWWVTLGDDDRVGVGLLIYAGGRWHVHDLHARYLCTRDREPDALMVLLFAERA